MTKQKLTLQTKDPQSILENEKYQEHIQRVHNITGDYNASSNV